MKLIYKGKFSGDVQDIPHGEHRPNAVKFREIDDPQKLGLVANLVSLGITALTIAAYVLRVWNAGLSASSLGWQFLLGALLSLVCLFPHELLHGLCFRKEVYLYTYWSHGMLFVTGPEDMSRARFVFMSLLPNLVFGAVPFVLGMIWPQLGILGALGAISLGAGAGDYYNVLHALTQMPPKARTYLYGFNSWWYLPEGVEPPVKKEKPTKEKPVKTKPVKEKPVKEKAVKEAPAPEAPSQDPSAANEPQQEEPPKETPPQAAPAKKEPVKKAPSKKEPAKKAPAKKGPAKKEPVKKDAAKKPASKKPAAKKSGSKKAPAPKTPSQKQSTAIKPPDKKKPKPKSGEAPTKKETK